MKQNKTPKLEQFQQKPEKEKLKLNKTKQNETKLQTGAISTRT